MATAAYVSNVETVLPDNVFIYSQTDLKGLIIEANQAFATISGYKVEDMLGKPHNLVRHPDMPKEAFADMWKSLKANRPWRGVVKNRRSDGGFYWVLANVSPVRIDGKVVGYQSLRLRPSRQDIHAASAAYALLKKGDKSIKVVEGRVVPVRAQWAVAASRSDFQLGLGAFVALVASVCGIAVLLGGDAQGWMPKAVAGLLALSGLFALNAMLRILPRLFGDLRLVKAYLDEVLTTGNMTQWAEFQRQDLTGDIGRNATMLVGWMQSSLQCIDDSLGRVDSASREVLSRIQEIDQAANSQSTASASVAAASTELSLTISEVTQHLQTTETTVGESGRKATEGVGVSQRASEHIQQLAIAIQGAATEVEALGASSAQVGEIAGVIREIADQTNLLALNASIEAARAGEAGRGFAVVANEVRSLADRTMKATAKIDALILAIKGDSDRAISGMRSGAAQVKQGVALVNEAEGALNGINSLMTDAVRMVSEIAVASSQQTEAMNDIGSNITHVAAMTEQSLGVVHHTTGLMETVLPLIERVDRAIRQYQV